MRLGFILTKPLNPWLTKKQMYAALAWLSGQSAIDDSPAGEQLLSTWVSHDNLMRKSKRRSGEFGTRWRLTVL